MIIITSMDQLKNIVWKITEITRGSLPLTESRSYIESLLALKASSDFSTKGIQNITLPESAKWTTIVSTSYNQIGKALNVAFREIEIYNPNMEGIFSGLDFDSETMGDKFRREEMLMRIIQTLSDVSFEETNLELNVGQLFESELKTGSGVYVPTQIVKLMVHLLSPEPDMIIYDPFSNDCTSLIESAKFLKEKYGFFNMSNFNAQNQNLDAHRTCMVNLIINGLVDAHITTGNIISTPKHICSSGEREGSIAIFDRVFGIIPMGIQDWGAEIAETDQYNRFVYGIPPRTRGEYGFLQHMIASTNKNGKLVAVVPKGATFRTGKAESRIRELMIRRDDIIEAVIDLPIKMFPQTAVQCSVLIINKSKPLDRKNRILFIDGGNDFEKGRIMNTLREEDIEKITNSYVKYINADEYCSVVSLEEIAATDFSLDVSRYISKPSPTKKKTTINIEDSLKELSNIRKRKDAVMDSINRYLEELKDLEYTE